MPAGCKVICAAGESVVKQERCVFHPINTQPVEFNNDNIYIIMLVSCKIGMGGI